MSSKTSSARHLRFLSSGFFPPELPPCFSSLTLAKYRNEIIAGLDSLPKRNGIPYVERFISHPIIFNHPRFRKPDRKHSVVNPIGFFALSRVISDNYLDLKRIAKGSHFSVSPPIFDWVGARSLVKPRFDLRDTKLFTLEAQDNFILHCDIQAFYHTLYTHVIPWAIHTKPVAKADRSRALYGNVIDTLCRNAQDGQTIGLPVGPDTSRMIAEVIASTIDSALQKRMRGLRKSAVRLVDDFSFGLKDRASAESRYALLRRVLREFELELNHEKMTVVACGQHGQVDDYINPSFVKSFARSLIPDPKAEKEQLLSFFYQLNILQSRTPGINIVKYTFQNSRKLFLDCAHWPIVEDFILSSYKKDSTLIEILVEIIGFRQLVHSDVDLKKIGNFIDAILPSLCEQDRHGEIIWLLYLCMRCNISVKSASVSPLFSISHALTSIMVAHAHARGVIKGKIDSSLWNKSLVQDALQGDMWLYAYESTLKSLSGSRVNDDFIKAHPAFRILYEQNIDFLSYMGDTTKWSPFLHAKRLKNAISKKIDDSFTDDWEFDIDEVDEEISFFDDAEQDFYS